MRRMFKIFVLHQGIDDGEGNGLPLSHQQRSQKKEENFLRTQVCLRAKERGGRKGMCGWSGL